MNINVDIETLSSDLSKQIYVSQVVPEGQKFSRGDLVRIAKDLGPHMTHFKSDCLAIVCYSDRDSDDDSDADPGEPPSYSLYLENGRESSWYEEHQLTLIEPSRLDLLAKWKRNNRNTRTKKWKQ